MKDQYKTPACTKIAGRRLDMSHPEVGSDIGVFEMTTNAKRAGNDPITNQVQKKPMPAYTSTGPDGSASPMVDSIKKFAASVTQSLLDRYENLHLQDPNILLFGRSTRAIPRRKYITAIRFASDPWMKGYRPPLAKGSSLTQSLQEYTRNATPETLNSPWIIHHSPRHISVTGADVRHQLLGVSSLDHEIFSALLRRFTQICMEENPDKPYMSYSHFMDLDFATLVLAGHDYTRLAHIQEQFIGSEIMYPLHACQIVKSFSPVISDC